MSETIKKVLACITFPMVCSGMAYSCKYPAPQDPDIIIQETRCQLPPIPDLPKVDLSICPPLSGLVACFDKQAAADLAARLQAYRQWIAEVRARCGQKANDGGPDDSNRGSDAGSSS